MMRRKLMLKGVAMKKQLLGIAIILLGILFTIAQLSMKLYSPNKQDQTLIIIGFAIALVGFIVTFTGYFKGDK